MACLAVSSARGGGLGEAGRGGGERFAGHARPRERVACRPGLRRTRCGAGRGRRNTLVKDLEVYRDDTPPPDYSLDTEVAGVLRAADASG